MGLEFSGASHKSIPDTESTIRKGGQVEAPKRKAL